MAIQRFEDVVAWQKAQDFAVVIYETFRDLRDFGFRDQLQRAAISISNNIAEGFDRSSNAEFIRFLFIALASCSEVKSMLYLANRLQYINNDKRDILVEDSTEISKIIRGLIRSMQP